MCQEEKPQTNKNPHTLEYNWEKQNLKPRKSPVAFLQPSSKKWGLIYRYNCNQINGISPSTYAQSYKAAPNQAGKKTHR